MSAHFRYCSLIPGLGVKLSTINLTGPTVLDVVVLAALALLDPDHHPLAVDVGRRTTSHARNPAA
jgi:hypothetical protein